MIQPILIGDEWWSADTASLPTSQSINQRIDWQRLERETSEQSTDQIEERRIEIVEMFHHEVNYPKEIRQDDVGLARIIRTDD